MSHPCHTLSNPSAQLFWCRHCMKIFEDPIQRWRHSKTCKKLVTSNPEQKIVGRDGRVLDVRAGNTENQVIVTDIKAQKDKNGTRKPKNVSELNCYICKKEFDSFESMKEHVKRSCNRPEIVLNKDPQSITSESLLVDRTKNDNVSVQIESLLKAAQQHQEQEQQKQQQQQQMLLTDKKRFTEKMPMEESLKDIHFGLLTDKEFIQQLHNEQVGFDGPAVDRHFKTQGPSTIDINAGESSKPIPDFVMENNITDTIEPIGTVITDVHIVTQGNIQQGSEEDMDSDLCTFVPPRCRIPVSTNIHYTETIDRTPKPISTIDHECVLLSDGTITDGETSVLITGAVQTVLNESKSLKRKTNENQCFLSKSKKDGTSDSQCFVSKPKKVKTTHTRPRVPSEEKSKHSMEVSVVELDVKNIEFGLKEKENVVNKIHLQSSVQNNNFRLNSSPNLKDNCVDNSVESSTDEISEISPCDNSMNKKVEVLPVVGEEAIQMNIVSGNSSKETKDSELQVPEKSSEKSESVTALSSPKSENESLKPSSSKSENESSELSSSKSENGSSELSSSKSENGSSELNSSKSENGSLELNSSKSEDGSSKLIVKDSETAECDMKIIETRKINGEIVIKINNKENNMKPDRQTERRNKKEVSKNETKENNNKDKKEEKAKTIIPKKKIDKPAKCRICDREFKSSQALQKHNKVPCKIKHTRNLTQKVLRPKRTTVQKPQLPEPKKKRNNSSKTAVNNKPKLLLRSDRRYSDTILSVKTKKGSKNKNRRKTLPDYNFHFSCCKQYDNSKLGFQVDYESLSEKEQYFFHLGMIPMSRLPSDMHSVVIAHRNLVTTNTSSVKENIEEDIFDGPFLPPPVLEKIPNMIGIEPDCHKVSNNEADLEPPVLEAISELNTNPKLLLSENEVVPKCQTANIMASNSIDAQAPELHEIKENAAESPTKKVENRHFLDVITKLSPDRMTDICCKTSPGSKTLNRQVSSEPPISPSKYSTNRHFTDIIPVSTDSPKSNNHNILRKDSSPIINKDDSVVSDEQLQKNNSSVQNHSAARHLTFSNDNHSSDCSDLNLDKNEKFCKITIGIQTENNSPEKVIYPSSSSKFNSQPGKNETSAAHDEKAKSQQSRNLFESFLNIGKQSVTSKNAISSAEKLTNSRKSCKLPAVNCSVKNSVVSQNGVTCTSKDTTVKGNYNNKSVKPTKYQEIIVYPPKKEPPISAPGPSIDKETTSNNNELLELLAKSLGIYPESQNSQSGDKVDNKNNVSTSSGMNFKSENDGTTSKPSFTKANLGDGNVQIIILNNSSSNQDYTTDINVIDVPKKNPETVVEPMKKSTKNTYVPVSTGYVNKSDTTSDGVDTGSFVLGGLQLTKLGKAEKLKYPLYDDEDNTVTELVENNSVMRSDDVHFSSNTIILPPTKIQDDTACKNSVQEMTSILPHHLQLHRTSSSSSGVVRPVSVPLKLSDSSCTTLRLQGPSLGENSELSGIQVLKDKKDCIVSSSIVNHVGQVYSNSVIFNSDADLQDSINSASCTNPVSPSDLSNKSANSQLGADINNMSSDLSQSSDVKIFFPSSVKNSLAQNTSGTVTVPALCLPESNLDEPCVMVQYIEQVQDPQNVSYVYFDEDNTHMLVDDAKYTEDSSLTSVLPVSYTL